MYQNIIWYPDYIQFLFSYISAKNKVKEIDFAISIF